MLPYTSDDHWGNSKRKRKNLPQGLESESVSCCRRSVRVFYSVTNLPSPLLHQFASPGSRDPSMTRSSFLKGLCLGAHTGASSLIMSQDGTPQFVPLYLSRSRYSNDVIKKWHLLPHCEKIFLVGARRWRYIFPKELTSATAFDVW